MLAMLAGGDTAHNVGAICQAIFCVSRRNSAGEALVHDAGMLANLEMVHRVVVASSPPRSAGEASRRAVRRRASGLRESHGSRHEG